MSMLATNVLINHFFILITNPLLSHVKNQVQIKLNKFNKFFVGQRKFTTPNTAQNKPPCPKLKKRPSSMDADLIMFLF
jgi:hypothetical protein